MDYIYVEKILINTSTAIWNKSIHFEHGEIFYYQLHTARKSNSDNELVRKYIDVNEHERLSIYMYMHNLQEQCLYCCVPFTVTSAPSIIS